MKTNRNGSLSVAGFPLTKLEAGCLFGYAMGYASARIAETVGSRANTVRSIVSQVCARLRIEMNHSAVLAFCLFHGAITTEQLFDEQGLLKKRRFAA